MDIRDFAMEQCVIWKRTESATLMLEDVWMKLLLTLKLFAPHLLLSLELWAAVTMIIAISGLIHLSQHPVSTTNHSVFKIYTLGTHACGLPIKLGWSLKHTKFPWSQSVIVLHNTLLTPFLMQLLCSGYLWPGS